jgi:aspartyl/asparaginyl beta-hydroxylase (cupin superfamily)
MNARSIKTVYSYLQAKHKQIVLTYGETLVRKLEDYIAKISLIPNATFFDADQFSWVQLLEANWHTKTAFFSILLPHKHIPEHRGLYKGLLRYHLALKVPKPDRGCGIQVGNDVRYAISFFSAQSWHDSINCLVALCAKRQS